MKLFTHLKKEDVIQKVTENSYKVKGKDKKRVTWEYENDSIITFDTETTSAFMDENGNVESYHPYENEAYWNDKIPVCCLYIWMLCINGEVIYGRTLEDFKECLDTFFDKKTHYIIYVHNFGFDFSFLQNVLPLTGVFARSERHPMKAYYNNIEFRCSYTLTNLSLEAWGKKIGLEKKVGDLEYNKLRTPLTELTEEEYGYCERDVLVQYEGLKEYLKKYEHIKDIPLTQTGEVRRVIKKKILNNKKLHRKIVKMLPENSYEYTALKTAFQGGYTHANYLYSGIVIDDGGEHFDFASSYPAVMCSEKFPMSPFYEDYFNPELVNDRAYLLKVRFYELEAKTTNHYIASSKCESLTNSVIDNGRIIEAEEAIMWMTEQDYLIIKESYWFNNMQVLECYSAIKEYLPVEIVSFVLELYANKTKYKDVEGMEDIYNMAKQFINSLFGMCVTDFINDIIIYSGGDWKTEHKEIEDVDEYLNELYNSNKGRTFLNYAWGVWITAYARKNLWDCMLKNDEKVVYCDTDSIFIMGKGNDFSWYNERVTEKLRRCCEHYNLDFELTRPKTPKGIAKPLGVFVAEEDWDEFVTLGAKRYCYRSSEDHKLHLTVSGINKGAVTALEDNIENFSNELVFDKDHKDVKKNLRVYVDDMPTVKWGDGYVSEYKHGVVLRPTSYSMSLSNEYIDLLLNRNLLKNYLLCI